MSADKCSWMLETEMSQVCPLSNNDTVSLVLSSDQVALVIIHYLWWHAQMWVLIQ